MEYSRSQLARLTHAHAASELSEQLISAVATDADGYGQGAFLTEEANTTLSAARNLLDAAVVADRLRGASWSAVGEALGVTKQSAQERFADAERQFREALLFPHRDSPSGGPGYTAAPYAAQEPNRVRERLDAWVWARRNPLSEPTEPAPVTRGLEAMRGSWSSDRIAEILTLTDMLMHHTLPNGVSEIQATRRHAELKVELYEHMSQEKPEDVEIVHNLADARAQLTACSSKEESVD